MTVRLNCGHLKPDDRVQNNEAYCAKCFRVSKVIGHLEGYKVKCGQCPLSRDFGADRVRAYRFAMTHQQRSGHTIRVGADIMRPGTLPLF